MFFRKKKVDYDDDYDNDDWDDLDDLNEEGGFGGASTQKSTARKVIGTLTGSFIQGVKNSAMGAETHRRIIKRSLPEGFVSHYDDILSVKRETGAIYDTVKKDVKKTHDEYRKELKPHINEYHKNKGGKASGVLDRWANRARDESGPSGPTQDELAFLSASEGVFGSSAPSGMESAQAEQNIAQAEDNAVANKVGALQAGQTNALLTHVGNQMNRQTAFNEQVAMRWKRKTLELQFKQFFVARKMLDVHEQTQGLLKASLESIVKNTALPDAVKIQTSEAAKAVLRDKFVGSIHDKGLTKFGELAGGLGKKLTTRVGETLETARGQTGMINTLSSLINKGGDNDFGQTPMELILGAIGEAGGNKVTNWFGDRIGKAAKGKIDESGMDAELLDARLQFAKAQSKATGMRMIEYGTGNDTIDSILRWIGAGDMPTSRNTTLQSNMEGNLRDQAIFDIETRKSITYSIPALLGEIHSELSTFRTLSHPGSKGPDNDNKLRMDWKTGALNTRGNIKKDMHQRMFTKERIEENKTKTRDILERLGFKHEQFDEEGNLKDEAGDSILLSSADIGELSKAFRIASSDSSFAFDPVDIAGGRSGLFTNKEAEARIADFFTEQLHLDGNLESMANAHDPAAAFKRRWEIGTKEGLKSQAILTNELARLNKEDNASALYEKYANLGQTDLLGEMGLVGLDSNNNHVFDARADVEELGKSQNLSRLNSRELQRTQYLDKYGIHYRAEEEERLSKLRQKKAAEDKKAADEALVKKSKELLEEAKSKKDAGVNRLRGMLGMEVQDPAYDPLKRVADKNSIYTPVQEGKKNYSVFGAEPGWAPPLRSKSLLAQITTKTDNFLKSILDNTFDEAADIQKQIKDGASVKEVLQSKYGSEWRDNRKDALVDYINSLQQDGADILKLKYQDLKDLSVDDAKEYLSGQKDKADIAVRDKISSTKDRMRAAKEARAAAANNIDLPEDVTTGTKVEVLTVNPADTVRGKQDKYTEEERNAHLRRARVQGARARNKAKGLPVEPLSEEDAAPIPRDISFRQRNVSRKIARLSGTIKPPKTLYDTNYGPYTPERQAQVDKALEEARLAAQPALLHAAGGNHRLHADMATDGYSADGKPSAEEWAEIVRMADGALGTIEGLENKFAGGRIGGNKTYSAGGAISAEEDSLHNSLMGGKRGRPSIIQLVQNTSSFVRKVAESYKIERENNGGRQPTLIVASEGEHVITNDENKSDIFRQLESSGWWQSFVDQVNTKEQMGPSNRITAETSLFNPKNQAGAADKKITADTSMFNTANLELDGTDADASSSKMSEWVNVTKKGFDGLGKQLGAFMGAIVATPEDEVEPESRVGKLKAITTRAGSAAKTTGSGIKTKFDDASDKLRGQLHVRGGIEMPEGYELTPEDDANIADGKYRKLVSLKEEADGSLIADYIYLNASAERSVDTKDTKKKGLIRRGLGGLVSLSTWGPRKVISGIVHKDRRKTAAGDGGAIDVFLIGEEEPIITAKDMKRGLYFDAKNGQPVRTLSEIRGEVLDKDGNVIISAEDIKEKRLVTRGGRPINSLLSTVAKGAFGLAGGVLGLASTVVGGGFGLMGAALGVQGAIIKGIFGRSGKRKVNSRKKDDFITQDVYVKGESKPRIKAKDVKNEEYINSEGKIVVRYGDLKGTIYDSDATIVLDVEDYEKGLVYPDGSVIGKVAKAGFGAVGSIAAGVFKAAGISAGILPMMASGAVKLAGAAFRGTGKFFGLLTGNGGGMSNSKYTMMLQTQAAAVDKLEMIRLILDSRMAKPEEAKHNDKDKDGYRDGSWYSNMMKKKDKDKDKDKDKKGKDDKDDKKKDKGLLGGMLEKVMGFITGGPVIAMAGGALIGVVAPFLMKAIGHGLKNILPTWLGGYKNDEERAAGKANIMAKAPEPGLPGSGEPGAPAGPDTVDAEGNVIPGAPAGPPLDTPMSLRNRAALGAAGGALVGTKTGRKVLKYGGKAAWGAAKWGIKKAAGTTVARAAGGMALRAAGTAVLHIAGNSAVSATVAALASNPVGWGIAAVVAIGLVAYGGYKLYKYLKSRKDNHLAEFRMNQYGFEIGNKNAVTKILDLEDYLKNHTTAGSKSTAAAIANSAQAEEAHRIFGINSDDTGDVEKFNKWFFGRFKPVYLSWQTAITRTVGRVELSKIDEMSFKEDKVAMIQSAHYPTSASPNPYAVMMSPLAEEDELEIDAEAVYSEYKSILKSLKDINAEEHDAKVSSKGGGPKNAPSKTKDEKDKIDSVTNKPIAGTGSANDTKALSDKKEDKVVKPEEEQSSWNKFLFGDKTKVKGFDPWTMGQDAGKAVRGWIGDAAETVGDWFGGGAGGPAGGFDASSKTLNLTEQDIIDIAKVTTTEVAMSLSENERKRQAAGVIDTILNRAVTGKWGNGVRDVINAKSQFSKIAGPASVNPYGSVQNMPTSAMNSEIAAFTREYLAKRAGGQKSIVDGNLSYANPNQITSNNRAWVTDISNQANQTGQRFGTGGNVHVHGTTKDMINIRPTGYKVTVAGQGGVAPTPGAPANISAPSDKPTSVKPVTPPETIAAPTKDTKAKSKLSNGILGGTSAKDLVETSKDNKAKLPAGGGVAKSNKTYLDGKGPQAALDNSKSTFGRVATPNYKGTYDENSNSSTSAPWMDIAKTQVGINEDANTTIVRSYHAVAAKQPNWDPKKYAWCASFVGWCLAKANVPFPVTARATDYAKYGKSISKNNIPYGAIIVLRFKTGNHVTFCMSDNGTNIKTLGGNQKGLSSKPGSTDRNGGEVTLSSVNRSDITAVVYPTNYTPGSNPGSNYSPAGSAGRGSMDNLLSFKLPDLGVTAMTQEDRDAARKNDYKGARKTAGLSKMKDGPAGQYGNDKANNDAAKSTISQKIDRGTLDKGTGIGRLDNAPFDIKDTNPYKAKDGVVDESRYNVPMPKSTGTTTSYGTVEKDPNGMAAGDYRKNRLPANEDPDSTYTGGTTVSKSRIDPYTGMPIPEYENIKDEIQAVKDAAQAQLEKYSGTTGTEGIDKILPMMVNGVQVLTDLSTQTMRRKSDGKILVRDPKGQLTTTAGKAGSVPVDGKASTTGVTGGVDKPSLATPNIIAENKAQKDNKVAELLRQQKQKEVSEMKEAETRQEAQAKVETDRTVILNESLTVQRSMDTTLREIAAQLKNMGSMNPGAGAGVGTKTADVDNSNKAPAPVTYGLNQRIQTVNTDEPISMKIH